MFHLRLIELRKDKKVTQQQLADKLHMTRATYAQYEIGRRKPDYDTLQLLADYFEVTVDYLLGRSSNPNFSEVENSFVQDSDMPISDLLKKYGFDDDPKLTKQEIKYMVESIKAFRNATRDQKK